MLGLVPSLLFFSFSWLATADTNMTAEDSQIIWPSSPPLWSSTATVCSSQGQSRFAYQANMSISYEFTGTAVYIRVLRSNVTGTYTVSIDGSTPVLADGFHTATICDIQFGQTGLPFKPHTVTVELFGPSPQSQNASSTMYLELDAFIYTTPDSSSPDNSSSSLTSISPISTTTPPSAASSFTGKSPLNAPAIVGIVIALMASFVAVAGFFFFLRRRKRRSSITRRLTVLDRDSVFPGHISQFPPPPNFNRTHQTNSSDTPLIHLADPTNTDQSSSRSQWRTSASEVMRNTDDAPPEYQAPGTKAALRIR